MDYQFPDYRACPDCGRDILEHEGVEEAIKIHGEEIKREIKVCRESYTPELFREHIEAELKKFTTKILDREREIRNPLKKLYRVAYEDLESWRNIVKIYKAEIENINNKESSPDSKRITQLKSYKWLNNPDEELHELYLLLTINQLISPDTTLDQLMAVFTAKPLQEIEPVKWHDDNASELLYFILQLESTESIEVGKQTNYKRLKSCFVKPNGEPFNSVFKTLKQRVEIELSEQKQLTIRSIVKSFL